MIKKNKKGTSSLFNDFFVEEMERIENEKGE